MSWEGGGLVSGSLRNSEISVSALTFLYCLRSWMRERLFRFLAECHKTSVNVACVAGVERGRG